MYSFITKLIENSLIKDNQHQHIMPRRSKKCLILKKNLIKNTFVQILSMQILKNTFYKQEKFVER